MSNTLPKETIDRITKDAINEYKSGGLIRMISKREGYITGATAEAQRAQALVEALKAIELLPWQNWQAQKIADKALAAYEGKEVENG